MTYAALTELAGQLHIDVRRELPLSSCTSFRIGGPAALYLEVRETEQLSPLLRCCHSYEIPVLILGNGSNLLVGDRGFAGAVLRPTAEPAAIRLLENGEIVCPAGVPLKQLCLFAREQALSGLEFAYGIPGTVGGALFMNAGAYDGQMADVVVGAKAAGTDGCMELAIAELGLGYRRSLFMSRRELVITEVTFRLASGNRERIAARMEELLRRRREKQPLEFPSAGSYFKRPEGQFAGALIEQCGLKGYRVGGAQISEKHAGFVVNRGGATCADVLCLERHVRDTVCRQMGIRLEREVQLVGE